MRTPHILVVAKAPEAGKVKTRLQPTLSAAQAAEMAAAMLADTLAAAAAVPDSRPVLALDGPPGDWIPPGCQVFPQCSGGLATRLAHAWAVAGGPGLQVGMDTPQADPQLLSACLASALAGEASLGLATDGGWWAIGFADAAPDGAFGGVPMSTSFTGAAQRARLAALGLRVTDLPVLVDVDRPDDLAAVAGRMPPESSTSVAWQRLSPSLVGAA